MRIAANSVFLAIAVSLIGWAAPVSPELDLSFDPGSGISLADGTPGQIRSLAVQTDGKIIVGGYFDFVNGTARQSIARLNPDGSLDETFKTSPESTCETVQAIGLQDDGRVCVGGFSLPKGIPRSLPPPLVRLNSDGTVDDTFRLSSIELASPPEITRIAVQEDKSILIAGLFMARFDAPPPYSLRRLSPNGDVDPTFYGSVNRFVLGQGFSNPGRVDWLIRQSDGKVLVAGGFTGVNYLVPTLTNGPTVVGGFARFNSDGSMDAGFNPAGFGTTQATGGMQGRNPINTHAGVSCLALQRDGKILVGRVPQYRPDQEPVEFYRLNSDGMRDFSFNSVTFNNGPVGFLDRQPRAALAAAVQNDGRILIGGDFTNVNSVARLGMARLSSDGTPDDFMSSGGIIGGTAHGATGSIVNPIRDRPFERGTVLTIAIQSDGRILIGGSFTNVNGVSRWGIARLHPGEIKPWLAQPSLRGGVFSVSLSTAPNKNYVLQSKNSLDEANWTSGMSVKGDGTLKALSDSETSRSQRFYRVVEL